MRQEFPEALRTLFAGAIYPEEGSLLYQIVMNYLPDIILETGTGYSTLFLAQATQDAQYGQVFSVDSDGSRGTRLASLLVNYGLTCHLIQGTIPDVINTVQLPIVDNFLAVVDSDHATEHVLLELEAIEQKATGNLIILGHDAYHDTRAGDAYKQFALARGLPVAFIPTKRTPLVRHAFGFAIIVKQIYGVW